MSCVNKEKCKRYDCLYHPQKGCLNGCDYILITGKKRGCAGGKECNKYEYATDEERLYIKRRIIEEEY